MNFHMIMKKYLNLLKSRSYITNSLRILTLPKSILSQIEKREISAGHAKILVGLSNAEFIANKIMKKTFC